MISASGRTEDSGPSISGLTCDPAIVPSARATPAFERRLDAFVRYLAQGYGRSNIAVANLLEDPSGRAAMFPDPGGGDVEEALEVLRGKMRCAPVGILVAQMPVQAAAAERHFHDVRQTLERAGVDAAFLGRCRHAAGVDSAHFGNREREPEAWDALVAVLHPRGRPAPEPAPHDFRVLAVVPTFNEEDVIAQTLRYLTRQQIDVHLLDNWSTDRTIERARPFLGHGLLAIERFPAEHAPRTYDLGSIMERVEDIGARSSWAHWVMLHDADERRCSPWAGAGLRDALWHVDRCGFSCIDHVTLNFWPVDDSFDPQGADLEQHFRYFEFSNHPGHFHQRRAWKQCGDRASLVPSAGHDVSFDGRRVYPYKFLLKHYPIRSRAHGERKVLHERVQRWNPQERAQGWHRQYDQLSPGQFVRDSRSLLRFDAARFATDYLIERLSGVGVFERPPQWATAPIW